MHSVPSRQRSPLSLGERRTHPLQLVTLIIRLLGEIELSPEMIWLITLSCRERATWGHCGEEMVRQQNGGILQARRGKTEEPEEGQSVIRCNDYI